MDPKACKQKDCDPCDDPDDCPDLAYAKPCDGGVHVFNRYVINSRPEHFWKYLGCKRVVVFSPDSYFCSLLCRTFFPKDDISGCTNLYRVTSVRVRTLRPDTHMMNGGSTGRRVGRGSGAGSDSSPSRKKKHFFGGLRYSRGRAL